jgi:3-methyladenine DNA glycosylase Mpg
MSALLPPADAPEAAYPPAFEALANLLLNQAVLHVQGVQHRFTELEFYYKGRQHVDKFTHGDPMQKRFGHWYFHRTGGEYRSGTYKGLDIAFGSEDAPAGILVRGIERLSDQELIDGPCLVVDHMLALADAPSIPALVARFDLSIDPGEDSPLFVTQRDSSLGKAVYRSPRVGLSLKRVNNAERHRFIARNYRFLTEPDRIKKGKPNLIIALHRDGVPKARIASLTNTKPSVIQRYLESYEEGRSKEPSVFGTDLSTGDLCALFGACEKLLTASPTSA